MAWTEAAQAKYRRRTTRYESDLTDAEWERIAPLLPAPMMRGRPRKVDLREAVNALLYQLATGCQWRALPHCFPAVSTVRYYFYGWRDLGVYDAMIDALRGPVRVLEGRQEAATAAVLDSQTVRTTESGGPSGYDAGKKIKGRKRHVAVDTIGLPLALQVHAADVQDRDGAPAVIAALMATMPSVAKVFADGAYGGPKLMTALAAIPCRADPGHRPETPRTTRLCGGAAPLGGGAFLRLARSLSTLGERLRAPRGEFAGVAAAGRHPSSYPASREGEKPCEISDIMNVQNIESSS